MGLLLNFKSFASFSYKIRLIKRQINRSFKICHNWISFHSHIENIQSNFIKYAYTPLLIDKVIKKHLDHKFSSNQTQLEDTSDICYSKLPYIGNLLHHIKKKRNSNFAKNVVKKTLTLNYFLTHLKLKISFHMMTQFLIILNLSQYTNILVLAVVPATSPKLVIILKLGLKNISKRRTILIFLNINAPPQHALTHIIVFLINK